MMTSNWKNPLVSWFIYNYFNGLKVNLLKINFTSDILIQRVPVLRNEYIRHF